MLSEKKVRFHMNDNVTEIRGVDGKVKRENEFGFIAPNSDLSIRKQKNMKIQAGNS